MTKKSFIELDKMTIKEKLAVGTALIAFGLGWGLTIAAFCVPPLGTRTGINLLCFSIRNNRLFSNFSKTDENGDKGFCKNG